MNAVESTLEVASFTPYPITHHPIHIELHEESMTVTWDHQHKSEYHYLWLRDNCHCPECISTKTREQVFEICDVPYTIKPSNAYITDDHRIVVDWDYADHTSKYHPGWLLSHCYSEEVVQSKQWKPILWDKERITTELPRAKSSTLIQSDEVLLTWLRDLRDYGIGIVSDVGTELGSLKAVTDRIAFMRESNYGTLFDVTTTAKANTSANTNIRLPLHTDLSARELQPGLQFLHCLVNDATGGESIYVDGFKIAEYMREHHPEEFRDLSTIPMTFNNKDPYCDYNYRSTVIATDSNGEVTEVRHANFIRVPIDVPAHQTMALYKAYQCFIRLTREPAFQLFFRLTAGEMVVFDNRRVLHARNAFDLKTGMRQLQGCYIDRDEFLSRIRILERSTTLSGS
ncbi:TauD/TfdA family dioxygenase [Marinomonas sp. GJ51-6]|uniref:TauD/TfdA family dioxygenase n=1 Tax=Marinomonas sp. GJ51-6 TaxID=2992802 RepID=UPI002934D955|nr:TauD/TfdA family dioxygenase [Marinomonas sp. GJ51-6]WOD06079.1 TauD/TfdA family dioxygenase [Marinomonas sp. GJ51-6]